jgi:cell division protein FtsB
MLPIDVAERVAVGIFTLGGLVTIITLVFRYQRVFIATAAERAAADDHEIAGLRDEVTKCRAESALLRAEVAELQHEVKVLSAQVNGTS